MREEEDLRAALRTLERHAPDPGKMLLTVRSHARVVAPPGRPRGFRHGADGAPRSWPERIAPLAAAVAVVGVVAGSVLLANVIAPTTVRPGGSRPQGMPTAAPLPLTVDGLPAYFAETPLSPHGGTLRIMATATAQTVATQ
jgi:hypothetical protein